VHIRALGAICAPGPQVCHSVHLPPDTIINHCSSHSPAQHPDGLQTTPERPSRANTGCQAGLSPPPPPFPPPSEVKTRGASPPLDHTSHSVLLRPSEPTGYSTYHSLQHNENLYFTAVFYSVSVSPVRYGLYLCVPYGSHSKHRLFPHTALTGWAL
jgi:hypothetical protein